MLNESYTLLRTSKNSLGCIVSGSKQSSPKGDLADVRIVLHYFEKEVMNSKKNIHRCVLPSLQAVAPIGYVLGRKFQTNFPLQH